jgi:hypothetical protein
MLRVFSVIVFLFFFQIIQAQVVQPKRYEKELGSFDSGYDVMTGEELGVIFYKATNEYKSGHQLWEFNMLDTALNERWQKTYYIDSDYIYSGYDYFGNDFFFLFQMVGKTSTNWLLIQMDIGTGDTLQHIINNLVRLQLHEFEVTDGAAIIGGYFNTNPVVIHYSMRTGKTKVLPGIYGNRTELVQVKILDDNSITILVSDRTYDKRNTLAVKSYDSEGNYLNNYVFEPDLDKGLIFGRVAYVEGVGTLVSGTYGGKRSEYSRGLFIGNSRASEAKAILYYNYADFENFFNYMKAKRQKRVAERISRKKIKGKKTKFNYRLIVHEILEDNGTYIMLGEAFYPKYSNSSSFYTSAPYYQGYSSRGNDYMPMNFAGYRYTHAVVIGFDRTGKLLWDNSFQIEDVLSFSLKQFVHADVTDDGVVLLYLYDDEIRSKIIHGANVLEGKTFSELKLSFADDIVAGTSSSNIGGLEKWYGDQFIAYGIQRIKNLRDSGVKMNRRVFFLNKIEYKTTIPNQ